MCQYLEDCRHGHLPMTAVCNTFEESTKAGHCVYCDHLQACHEFYDEQDFEKNR